MIGYRGFSLKELKESFTYDPDRGLLFSNKSGKIIGSFSDGTSIYTSKRRGHTVVQLRVAPLVWFLYYGILPAGEVWFKDGNTVNIEVDNLFVVKRGASRTHRTTDRVVLEKTSDEGILYNPLRDYYLVKRGKKFASYMAQSFEEALSIRNEWKEDNSIKRWDYFHKNTPYYENNNYSCCKKFVNTK